MAGNVNVGTLEAKLVLDSAPYKKGTEDAIQATGKLDAGLVNLAAGLNVVEQGYRLTRQAIDMYVGAATDAYSSVKEFQRMTGTTTEQAGKWHDMLELMGLDLEDLSAAFRMFSNNVDAAMNDPKSNAAEAFRKLGVSLTDSNGKLKDSNTLMLETLSALGKLPDGASKNALANDTLGRSYMNLNKLIAQGTDAQKKYGETTTDITEDGIKRFNEYEKSMNEFNASIKEIETNVGSKLMPILTLFADLFGDYIVPAINGALSTIETFGRNTGDAIAGLIGLIYDVNDAVASTKIGEMLGFKPVNRAWLTNWNNSRWQSVTKSGAGSSGGAGAGAGAGGSGAGAGGGSGSPSGSSGSSISSTGGGTSAENLAVGINMQKMMKIELAEYQQQLKNINLTEKERLELEIKILKLQDEINTSIEKYGDITVDVNAALEEMAGNVQDLTAAQKRLLELQAQGAQGVLDMGDGNYVNIQTGETSKNPFAFNNYSFGGSASQPGGMNMSQNSWMMLANMSNMQKGMRPEVWAEISRFFQGPRDYPSWEYGSLLNMAGAEYRRLTTGKYPMYSVRKGETPELIIYLTVDGHILAKTVVDRLRLLGAKV